MNPAEPTPSGRPAKIQPHHLDRWAIVYVRQSGLQQVQRHRESAEVQANLQHFARQWGWPADRIRVLDGDQGCSGTTTVGRDDFAWLLAEIALGHVGLVLGFQINRLAREDEACCRLIKVCSAFDTLLADQDGLYHPHDFNDRLILSIKGLMGGFELHQLQQRMQAGRLNRARRGEWLGQPPPGFIVGPDGKLQFDADEQVHSRIRLVLDQFAVRGSLSGVLRYLVAHQLDLPFRPRAGSQPGLLQWHRPQRETLRNLLRHPAYAGVYTWGRRARDPRRAAAGRGGGRVERAPQDCAVFRPNNHPAYLSWEQYQHNVQCLRRQRSRGPVPGPARTTVALLAGLVVCGVCGCRMQTRYTKSLRYDCQRHALDYAAPACQSLAGAPLEQLLAEQVLQVVTPASLELSLHAAQECERARATLDQEWQLRLQRGQQDVDRAGRQYDAVEPENRLVARTLERRWEEALAAQRTLVEEHQRFQQTQPTTLSAAERAQIEALAHDLPALWRAPRTSVTDKRQVMRLLVQRVVVWAPAASHEVRVQVHWTGGPVTEHQVRRPVRSWSQLGDRVGIAERLRQGQAAGWTARRLAEDLNAHGHRTPRGQPFTAANVRQWLARHRPGGSKKTKRRRKKH